MRRVAPLVLPLVLVASCGGDEGAASPTPVEPQDPDAAITVFAVDADVAALEAYAAPLATSGMRVVSRRDPRAALSDRAPHPLRVALVRDLSCGECYRVEGSAGRFVVHGGGLLGVQYGLSHLLEEVGFRFFHPRSTHVPKEIVSPDGAAFLGQTITPEIAERGLSVHTLHPIEAYDDFWEPGAENLAGAQATIDWIVKNRANYLQWIALDSADDDDTTAFRAHTRSILDYAHLRGVRAGIAVQLFGANSLQKSFTVFTKPGDDATRADAREQLAYLLKDMPFDNVMLSFGEFGGHSPESFLSALDATTGAVHDLLPDAKLSASVHVGNYPKLRVSYMGEEVLYYFLVKWGPPEIVPWVHTVMYFNLFDPAGGAYNHDDFGEHQAFLFDRLANRKPVGYHPETAYWVAFDDSVPTYLPVYVSSRHEDLAKIQQRARDQGLPPIDSHVDFSSGWEWGYWQNDWALLRMNHTLPAKFEDALEHAFLPFGDAGRKVANAANAAARAQHDVLIRKRAGAYLAGSDDFLDLGAKGGTTAQPRKVSFDALVTGTDATRADFSTNVLAPLRGLADALSSARAPLAGDTVIDGERFLRETRDGLDVTDARVRFVVATYDAAIATDAAARDAALTKVDDELAKAKVTVQRRHADLHHPRPASLLTRRKTLGLYQYGYLLTADQLCYWERERAQLRNLLLKETNKVPPCVL